MALLDSLVRDVRYALRSLWNSRGLSLAALLTLALGMGANTAIFTAVDAILLRPLAVPGLDRLVVIRDDMPGLGMPSIDTNAYMVEQDETRTDLFEAVGAYRPAEFTLSGFEEPAQIAGAQTVGGFFRVFGIQPALGRFFEPEDEGAGRQFVAVLSYDFWQRVYGGDRAVIGRTIQLDENPYRIAGVLPKSFPYPRNVEVLTPMPKKSSWRESNALIGIARLRPGMSIELARPQLGAWSRTTGEHAGITPAWRYSQLLVGFVPFVAGQMRPVLLVLLAAVAFVLLLACTNLAGLQLARATVREREYSVRVALGAGRWAIVRQCLVESAILALAGGAAGLLIGSLLLDALSQWNLQGIPALDRLTLNPAVLWATGAVALAAGFGFGLVPALRASRADAQIALRESTRGGSPGARRHRALETLAVAQIGLALVLLVSAGLLVRSLANLLRTNPGFESQHVISAQISLPRRITKSYAPFAVSLEDRVQHLPGVSAAGIVSELPFTRFFNSSPFEIVGRPSQSPRHADLRTVDSGYFAAMGIPLLSGRLFGPEDGPDAQPTVIVDAQLARQYFPGENPIGQRIGRSKPVVIVGVVGTVTHSELGAEPKATLYFPFLQRETWSMFLVARTTLPEAAVAGELRAAVASLDRGIPLADVQTMPQRIQRSLATRRMAGFIMLGFAALAVALAVLGTYGVLSYSISQRTHEIGIRIALGAQRGNILSMMLRRGLALAAAGLCCGILATWWLGRFLSSLLFGVGPRDPLTILGGAALLAAVTLVACYLPARRAADVDPGISLRWE